MINNNEELVKVLKQSEKEALLLKNEFVGTEHLLLGILNSKNTLRNILINNELTYESCKKEINKLSTAHTKTNIAIYTPLLKRLIMNIPSNSKSPLKDLFIIFLEEGEGIGYSILNSLNINIKNLYNMILQKEKNINYGLYLNETHIQNNVIGRENEINQIIEVLLRKNKTNPLLIGEAGTGKTAIVEELAHRINTKKVPKELQNKKILSINISSLVSGTKYRGEFEEKLNNLINDIEKDKNTILFIDEIHTIVGAGGAEGAIDAANILKPYLARNTISCIGATTINEYNKSIKNDKALNRRFNPILIKEPTYNQTLNILENTKKYYEKFHNVKISKQQIKMIVDMSNKYIKNKAEPDKSLEILDTICTKTKLINSINNNDDLIKKLNNTKNLCLKNKEYDKAIKVNLNIKKLLSKKSIYKVDDNTISNYFTQKNQSKSFGFKYN